MKMYDFLKWFENQRSKIVTNFEIMLSKYQKIDKTI